MWRPPLGFADSSRSSIPKIYRGLMSQTESPDEFELDRLRTAVQDYEKKLFEAAELVARVRHEINNPLAALLGQAQLLLREDLSEKSRRRAETIESQAKRIEQIVGELRAIQAPPTSVNNQG
jgi:signal transduction histidine kinase